MDDVGKSRNELIEEVTRLHRVRHHVRQTGFEALQEQVRLQEMLRESMDAIVMFDADGLVQLFSRGAEQLFGCEEADVLSRSLDGWIPCPPAFGEDVPRYLADVCASKADLFQHPVEVSNATGEKRKLTVTVSLSGRGKSPAEHDYHSALCIFQDITRQKHALQEVGAYRDNLESLVKDLSNELRVSKEDLSLASHAEQDAVELLLQEIRAPLGRILDVANAAAAMRTGAECNDMQEGVRTIRHTAGELMMLLKVLTKEK
ncbi:MAG: PAS domain S-box protein [gamma proteobacterium endosymbiont of Lamellibrachia anaximandri]|nr:PAS domain S-box protein [gamma proteobacterium endosymbiont of Lamellibrachia anaximandri]